MEAVGVFGAMVAGLVAMVLVLKVVFWIVLFVLAPLLWVWMLVDAIARRDEDYPTGTSNEKILWIVLIVVFHLSALVYWFVVYRAARQGVVTAAPAAPDAPGAAGAPMAPVAYPVGPPPTSVV